LAIAYCHIRDVYWIEEARLAERLLTVEEVAERVQASAYTVRKWMRDGKLRGTKLGGDRLGWRVTESEVRRFVESGGQPPPP
jgi:excisionase family DNA binding protein